MTFAAAMRAFLRADPDVIMVGEMRDEETADIAIEASLTGHLVLSTLHTNSAAESIVRLLDMGMDPFNFADALVGVLSQRLTRTLCTSCKKPYHPDQSEIEFLAAEYCRDSDGAYTGEMSEKEMVAQQISQWETLYASREGFTLYKAPGCLDCLDTGYRGRMGVHELLIVTPNLKQMILRRASAADIHREGIRTGMTTRRQDGIEKILLGYTDFSQIRVV